jgi:hypothetical protein
MSWRARLAIFALLLLAGGVPTWVLLPPEPLEAYVQPLVASWGYELTPWGWWGVRLGVTVAVGLIVWFLVWLLAASIKRRRRARPEPEPDEYTRLLQALRSPDPAERRQAAVTLGDVGDERAVDPLLHLLHESTNPERRAAAEALYKIGRVLTAMVTQERRR